eukprot:7782469-Pyramimonas_sp.AAC.1
MSSCRDCGGSQGQMKIAPKMQWTIAHYGMSCAEVGADVKTHEWLPPSPCICALTGDLCPVQDQGWSSAMNDPRSQLPRGCPAGCRAERGQRCVAG